MREGCALQDNLFPTRIIVGSKSDQGKSFADLLSFSAEKSDIPILLVDSTEAESIKLFANTYLAMRVAFFNELDSYALTNKLDTSSIILGMSFDERIGNGYNNPSFGYGGYCLPKDTKQLLANFDSVPQALIEATISSNSIRKDFIANEILKKKPNIVGFYRLVMKEGSDNFRSSAAEGIIKRIKNMNIKVVIYEPIIDEETYLDCDVMRNKNLFMKSCCLIVANRYSPDLEHVKNKVFTRDHFNTDT